MTMTRRQILMAAGAAAAARPTAAVTASAARPTFDDLMQQCADAMLAEHPQGATSLGLDTGARAGLRARWDDRSRDGIARQQSACAARLTELRRIDAQGLTADQRLTLDTVIWAHQLGVDGRRFVPGVNTLQAAMTQTATPYVVSQMTGAFAELPDFLSREQPIATRHDVDAWLQRLEGSATLLDAETERLREDHARGVAPPLEVLNTVLNQMADALAQPPAESDMARSLARQCAAIGATEAPLATAHRLIEQTFQPALARQHRALATLRAAAVGAAADERPGMQRLPDGEAHYAWLLKVSTSTDMTPDAIHAMGLEQSSRIAAEMERTLCQLGYRDGPVGDRLQALAADTRHRFANDDAGRAAALAHANALLARGREAMPRLSRLGLRADVRIERVPPSIERGAAGAYVTPSSLDAARPALFSLNLHDTAIWPRWALPTLVFHETVPGHVWQEAYGAERQPWPLVRALVRFNASSEGWALYAEQLADEIGLYEGDTLGRLGYLQAMQLRASRLVVDTGLHANGWSRTQAIDWMTRSTGRPRTAMVSEVDRYCVKPGQACGYMVGLQQLLALRTAAQHRLGARFDLRDFNDRVVASGNVPFGLLADRV